MQFGLIGRRVGITGCRLDEIGADVPAQVFKELTPGYDVIFDVDESTDVVVHMGALLRSRNAAAATADVDFLVILGAFKRFALTVDVEREVGVVVDEVGLVGHKANRQNDDCP